MCRGEYYMDSRYKYNYCMYRYPPTCLNKQLGINMAQYYTYMPLPKNVGNINICNCINNINVYFNHFRKNHIFQKYAV